MISFRGTAIKSNMSKDFASLLCTCPLIKSLKYVRSINICFFTNSNFNIISVSKCSVIVKTLSDISNNIPDFGCLTELE